MRNLIVPPPSNRKQQWELNWKPEWRSFLFYGSIDNDTIHMIFSKNISNVKVFWFPTDQSPRIRTRCNDLKRKYGDSIKIIPGELNPQFRISHPFHVIYWNGSHHFLNLTKEFYHLYQYSSPTTQWIAHHVAPQRHLGKYPYGYLRLVVEHQWIDIDQWYEESSDRGIYDEAWCWFHFKKMPPMIGMESDSWDMPVEGRQFTGTKEWKIRERKVRITKWTALVEAAKTADEYESLEQELKRIEESEYDEVDEWALKIWNESPGQIIRSATRKIIN